jgi:carboxyl-terminal processing protease
VTVELLDESERPREGLSAGESGFLKVTVENKGDGPFRRLAAVTKSEDPLFANLEFPLGLIGAGQTRSWKTPLKIPDFVHRRKIPVEVAFREADGQEPKPSTVSLQVEEPEAPLFEYSYRVIDNGAQGSKGNGNGRADRGETVTLALTVKNGGKGESKAPVVNLKKVEGEEAFIERGREELKPIPPGGEAKVALTFRVPEALKGELSFDLNIHDMHLGEDLSDRMDFSGNSENPPPAQNLLHAPPLIEVDGKNLPLTASGESYALKGTVSDDVELRHLFVFVGDNKAFYQAPSGASKTLAFETKLPLKKGANLITLAAQDDRELTSRKQWIVWREK